MSSSEKTNEAEFPKLSDNPVRRFVRFLVAVCSAFLVAFAMLLFMRYLAGGFDDSASDTLTRYISLPSITINRQSEAISKPLKPRLEPEYDLLQPMVEDEGGLPDEDSALELEDPPAFKSGIEIQSPLPALENSPDSDREKMQRIREALTAETQE